jgi:hypothetical protein
VLRRAVLFRRAVLWAAVRWPRLRGPQLRGPQAELAVEQPAEVADVAEPDRLRDLGDRAP